MKEIVLWLLEAAAVGFVKQKVVLNFISYSSGTFFGYLHDFWPSPDSKCEKAIPVTAMWLQHEQNHWEKGIFIRILFFSEEDNPVYGLLDSNNRETYCRHAYSLLSWPVHKGTVSTKKVENSSCCFQTLSPCWIICNISFWKEVAALLQILSELTAVEMLGHQRTISLKHAEGVPASARDFSQQRWNIPLRKMGLISSSFGCLQ